MHLEKETEWQEIITPRESIFSLNLRQVWEYRDLLIMLVRRDVFAIYKQTILGPIWFFIQPVLTTITFVIIFYKAAGLGTMNLPPVLFYLSGIVLWAYFSECVLKTANCFKDYNPILSKVYFPRLIIPLAVVITNLVKLGIQLLLFAIVFLYFLFKQEQIEPNGYALLLPLLVVLIAGLGLGAGMIIASLTTRYKDLIHLITFGIQLLMFVSPVIFPLANVANEKYRSLLMSNPMTGIIEAFRFGFLGSGYFSWNLLAYDAVCVILLMVIGVLIFNSTEKNFVDTI